MPARRRAPSICDAAAQRLGVAAAKPGGRATAPSPGPAISRTSYWELADEGLLGARCHRADRAPSLSRRAQLAGTAAARIDIPDKVFGRPRFVHDLALPGMLHGARAAAAIAGRDADGRSTRPRPRAMPGVVAVVRDGSFVGVVAETRRG